MLRGSHQGFTLIEVLLEVVAVDIMEAEEAVAIPHILIAIPIQDLVTPCHLMMIVLAEAAPVGLPQDSAPQAVISPATDK